ncbi:type II toxin-antitoxin system death-on-curing family toxin [Enterococcus pseudoavium]|uniref:Type II toxin-antitoxin system death-on-curing family toxin n=1 Tax=Enterococcus pseudoavium TaxID=44007 RepID=A0AAE4KVN9_9ENTE|nr:type II toxin-antitoxin system death-on-curing family toxin [Enterococcus pseudoavium]MDT2735770.1 type II toxin-antitoxin system death-on-curing family toxin [Enterococcus pseudoavium]MDT2755575.1 type II toxin-antitoxin system death-on-curing family toxin [Enterococcus pseudoavium]MDT2769224.1 type II toxin-antitoxin system death-on-curing family toxin [Enterococcus pseudoavium]REC31289.1 type II toxin-antitoxin system death-on-curing family toxin [Enterococcus pseudoavium]
MRYLTVKDIVKINAKLITKVSAGELIGIKDAAALDMAVNQPQQEVFGEALYPTIYDKASILAINLAKRHPFQNGNKRTALVSMITFLMMNGYTISFTQEEAVSFILNITTSTQEFDNLKEEVSNYLKTSGKVNIL